MFYANRRGWKKMPRVNPEILVWARKAAGLTQDVAAKKLGFQDSVAEALSTSRAARILGVTPRQVQPLLDAGHSS